MIFASLLMSSLPFLAVDFPAAQLPAQFAVTRPGRGNAGSVSTIVATDPAYVALVALLREERSGWHGDYASYVPRLTFKGKDMSINCMRNRLVVNYTSRDGSMAQISKVIKRRCPGDDS